MGKPCLWEGGTHSFPQQREGRTRGQGTGRGSGPGHKWGGGGPSSFCPPGDGGRVSETLWLSVSSGSQWPFESQGCLGYVCFIHPFVPFCSRRGNQHGDGGENLVLPQGRPRPRSRGHHRVPVSGLESAVPSSRRVQVPVGLRGCAGLQGHSRVIAVTQTEEFLPPPAPPACWLAGASWAPRLLSGC